MLKRVRIDAKGSTDLLPGALEDRHKLKVLNKQVKDEGGTPAKGEEVILGITKASLATESFLSAASFQETTKVLTDAALEGKRDKLVGLKENVIIGKLIPAATGLRHYRSLEIEPVEPAQRPEEDLLDEDELAAELGLAEDGEARQRPGGLRPLVRRGARGARSGDRDRHAGDLRPKLTAHAFGTTAGALPRPFCFLSRSFDRAKRAVRFRAIAAKGVHR